MESDGNLTACGIDLGGTTIRAGVVDQQGRLLMKRSMPTPHDADPQIILDNIIEMITSLPGDMTAVGVGAPGPLDSRTGRILTMPNLPGWENFPLRDHIRERVRLPVTVLNDADAFAWCEHMIGAGKDVPSFALVTLGTGLGSSLVLNDRLWTGASGMSPELGHIPVSDSDAVCGCGRRNHLEAFVSSKTILDRVRKAIRSGAGTSLDMDPHAQNALDVHTIARHAADGDGLARKEIERYARYLGRGLAVLANLLNLELVIIAGGVAGAWETLEPVVRVELERQAFPRQAADMRIVISAFRDWGGVIGAGLRALPAHDCRNT